MADSVPCDRKLQRAHLLQVWRGLGWRMFAHTWFAGRLAQAQTKTVAPSLHRGIKAERAWTPNKAWMYSCPRHNSRLRAALAVLIGSHWSRRKVDEI